ncbi:MAG TPA: hypothetical protein VK152_03885 [Paludibacter sp.]|nr:hypothetical protein [Paludibacter sp.]
MNTLKHLILLVAFVAATATNARNKCPEEFHEKKWHYLVEKAQLKQTESDLVKPVFLDYEKNMWERHEKNRQFFKSVMDKNKDGKPNFAELNDRYAEEELAHAQLFKNYHLRLRVLLPPETLFRYYRAEREFKRELLRNMPGRPHSENKPQQP